MINTSNYKLLLMDNNEKLKVIVESKDWVSVDKYDYDAEVSDNVQTIHCDTRDFHIICGTDKPELFKEETCGFERRHNEGLGRLHSLFSKTNKEKYSINKNEIIKWLDNICNATGGYEEDWRCLSANVKNCDGWDIKYLRFVRDDKNRDKFIVCNSYMFPIEYREIINNLNETK